MTCLVPPMLTFRRHSSSSSPGSVVWIHQFPGVTLTVVCPFASKCVLIWFHPLFKEVLPSLTCTSLCENLMTDRNSIDWIELNRDIECSGSTSRDAAQN